MTNAPAPRPSSIPALEDGSPNPEWLITEDGVPFAVGDRLFDYYDFRWVVVAEAPEGPFGWFRVRLAEFPDSWGYSTNSVRLASKPPAWWTGTP